MKLVYCVNVSLYGLRCMYFTQTVFLVRIFTRSSHNVNSIVFFLSHFLSWNVKMRWSKYTNSLTHQITATIHKKHYTQLTRFFFLSLLLIISIKVRKFNDSAFKISINLFPDKWNGIATVCDKMWMDIAKNHLKKLLPTRNKKRIKKYNPHDHGWCSKQWAANFCLKHLGRAIRRPQKA